MPPHFLQKSPCLLCRSVMILVSPQVKQKRDEEELEDDLSSAAQSLYRYVKVARNAKSQQ